MVKRGFIALFSLPLSKLLPVVYSVLLTWRASFRSPSPHLYPHLLWIVMVNLLPVGLPASPVLMNQVEKRQDDCHQMATSAEEP